MQKDEMRFKLKLLPLALLSCCVWSVSALAGGYLPPRLSVDANAGGSATVGQADLLLSLKGDERRNLYLDPQAAYGSDEQWYADLGLGYRWIQNDAAILGGYVFAGHSQVTNQSGFWIANPGVEALGSRWDARINGYIPIGSRSDDKGVFSFIQSNQLFFSGHTQSSFATISVIDETQQIGDGVDAKVGYQVFRNVPLKAYLGAYFFNISNADNVRGGAAGVEYWFDQHVKTFVNYTYDNLQHSTVVGGLAVSFGGVDEARADPSLSERLTDPVERYLANLGHGSGIPSETLFTTLASGTVPANIIPGMPPGPNPGPSPIPLTNIAFFSQTGTPNNGGVGLTMANCTFANPCGPSDFSQTGVNTLNALLPSTLMYFNGGTYPATNNAPNGLTLNSGQAVIGTVANYSALASGAARSTFNGSFLLSGNNVLSSIILNNTSGANTTAISSIGGQDIRINNVLIGTAGNPYGIGITLVNASATLTESTLNTNGSVGNRPGIFLSAGASLLVQSSNLNINALVSFPGILANNNSSLTLVDSQLNVSGSSSGGFFSTPSGGAISVSSNSAAFIDNSNINYVNTSFNTTSYGLVVQDATSMIAMQDGSLNVSGGFDASLTNGPNISFSGVSCTLYGGVVRCQ